MAYESQKDIETARERHKSEEIGTKRRRGDVLNAQGKSIVEEIWSIGVTELHITAGDRGAASGGIGGRKRSPSSRDFRSDLGQDDP